MARFDEARFALEAATGGKNTLILDEVGMPSVMVRIPRFNWSDVMDDGADEPCSAFVVGGEVKDCIYISKYLNIVERGRAYSLPNREPAHTLSIDEARQACARKGPGWHLITNAEWMAIAFWSRMNGTLPHGNNQYGCDIAAPHRRGVKAPPAGIPMGPYKEGRTFTGSGPDDWSHDGTSAGIFDLAGNVWDFVAGLRIMDGELQVIPDNDSALNVDESPSSVRWKAVDTSGSYVEPGSVGTYKYDGIEEGNADSDAALIQGGVRLSTEVTKPLYTGEDGSSFHSWTMMPMGELTAADGIPVHQKLLELGLYPVADSPDRLFVRNYGEHIAFRGGSWLDGNSAGLWELYIRDARTWIFPDVGFRAAYVNL